MEDLVQADIFFFISSVGFILLFALGVVVVVYAVQILRRVNEITKKVQEEGEAIIHDVRSMRESLQAQKGKILAFLGSLFVLKELRKKKKKKSE